MPGLCAIAVGLAVRVGGLQLFGRLLREFGHPHDQFHHLEPKLLLDQFRRILAILHHIVQQARGDGLRVRVHIGQDVGHSQRMGDVVIARASLLSPVQPFRELIRLAHHLQLFRRQVFQLRQNLIDSRSDVFCHGGGYSSRWIQQQGRRDGTSLSSFSSIILLFIRNE